MEIEMPDLGEVASVTLADPRDDEAPETQRFPSPRSRDVCTPPAATSRCDTGRRRISSRSLGHARRSGSNHRSTGSRRTTSSASSGGGGSSGDPDSSEPGEHSRLTLEVVYV
jgi:hypothetical protein